MLIRFVMNKGKSWGRGLEMIVKRGQNCWCPLSDCLQSQFSEGSGGVQGGERSEEYMHWNLCSAVATEIRKSGKACLCVPFAVFFRSDLTSPFFLVALRSQFSGVNPVCSPHLPPHSARVLLLGVPSL